MTQRGTYQNPNNKTVPELVQGSGGVRCLQRFVSSLLKIKFQFTKIYNSMLRKFRKLKLKIS